MSSSQFCGKKCFSKVAMVYFECFVRETNCCVCTTVVKITKTTYHAFKGRILAEFLKIRCADGNASDRTHLRAFKSSVKSVN